MDMDSDVELDMDMDWTQGWGGGLCNIGKEPTCLLGLRSMKCAMGKKEIKRTVLDDDDRKHQHSTRTGGSGGGRYSDRTGQRVPECPSDRAGVRACGRAGVQIGNPIG